jgi:hypothetical protein
VRVGVRLPKVHGQASTLVEIYTAADEDACCLNVDDHGQGMGLVVGLWTTRTGLEVLRDELNAVLAEATS